MFYLCPPPQPKISAPPTRLFTGWLISCLIFSHKLGKETPPLKNPGYALDHGCIVSIFVSLFTWAKILLKHLTLHFRVMVLIFNCEWAKRAIVWRFVRSRCEKKKRKKRPDRFHLLVLAQFNHVHVRLKRPPLPCYPGVSDTVCTVHIRRWFIN